MHFFRIFTDGLRSTTAGCFHRYLSVREGLPCLHSIIFPHHNTSTSSMSFPKVPQWLVPGPFTSSTPVSPWSTPFWDGGGGTSVPDRGVIPSRDDSLWSDPFELHHWLHHSHDTFSDTLKDVWLVISFCILLLRTWWWLVPSCLGNWTRNGFYQICSERCTWHQELQNRWRNMCWQKPVY